MLPLLAGCYTLQPVSGTSPEVGSRIAVDVTDAGRLALGGSMGPEIGQIEGTLIQRDNGEYLLGVRSISLLRGGVQVWSGEPVHIKQEYVSTVYQRQLSKGRTIALAAVGVGAVALVASQNMLGGGNVEGPKQQPADTAVTRRSPRTVHFTVFSIGLPGLSSSGRR